MNRNSFSIVQDLNIEDKWDRVKTPGSYQPPRLSTPLTAQRVLTRFR